MIASLFDASVWCALAAAAVAAAASILFLRTRNFLYDSLALAVTETALVILGIGIVAGAVAGHAATGLWWTWNTRLTTALVCWLLYAPYLMLRSAVEEPSRRAASAAVASVFALFDVPLIAVAVHWWRSRHAPVADGLTMAAWWTVALLALACGAFSWIRFRQEQQRRAMDAERRTSQEL